MTISLRKFDKRDIPAKVRWINDPRNNRFLHYDLPLEEDKTAVWYERIKDLTDRYDAVIEVDGVAVGLIGLLSIDRKNKKAEFYVSMGETAYKGRGVATEASRQLIDYAFSELHLNKIYLYTEVKNVAAQRLVEKIGFAKEGCVVQDLYSKGSFVDRFIYGLLKDNWRK